MFTGYILNLKKYAIYKTNKHVQVSDYSVV